MEEEICDTCKYQSIDGGYGPTCRRNAPKCAPIFMPGELFLRGFWPILNYGEKGCGEWASELEPTGEANKS